MKPAPFEYLRPATLDDALDALATTEGKVLAGGQSLVPLLSMRLAAPAVIVDVNRIPGLDGIDVQADGVLIGALVRHSQLERSPAAYQANPLLRRTLHQVAHPAIRNRGTTVGSLVHADPAAEMPAVLCLLGGYVEAVSRDRGIRRIEGADFFVGPLESALRPDELAVAAFFPSPPNGSGTAFVELARRQGDYAMAGVGAVVELDGDTVASARVGLVSVGATPVVVDLTNSCAGRRYDAGWEVAGEQVTASIEPDGDIHATAEYREHLARVLTRRVLAAAAADARDRRDAAA